MGFIRKKNHFLSRTDSTPLKSELIPPPELGTKPYRTFSDFLTHSGYKLSLVMMFFNVFKWKLSKHILYYRIYTLIWTPIHHIFSEFGPYSQFLCWFSSFQNNVWESAMINSLQFHTSQKKTAFFAIPRGLQQKYQIWMSNFKK